jgi:phosphoglucomutase
MDTPNALAGKPAPAELLIDPKRLVDDYYTKRPDPLRREQRVSFGTSGHRGSPSSSQFNEVHILAVTQAICDYRRQAGISGPLFLGKDTHAASEPAERTALEVLAANAVETVIEASGGFTPTPSISRAILRHNASGKQREADGIVVTPSHNPPEDGGFKYNPPNGGPADSDVTRWIQDRANALIEAECRDVRRVPLAQALAADTTHRADLLGMYVDELATVIDLELVKNARLKLGVDPLGGASVMYWPRIAERWGLDVSVVGGGVDPRFSFMTVDHDGKIRMDCSSPFAMQNLLALRERFDVAFGNDPDADRHGIVARSSGLLNPNHFLAVAVDYLFRPEHRPSWAPSLSVGKTAVSSMLIDKVAAARGRALVEVPVGFKWFVPGLSAGTLGFGGEESAGASLLRRDGSTWTTDKDGIVLCLLAAEMTARTGRDPGQLYDVLRAEHGTPFYRRIDVPASVTDKERLGRLSPDAAGASTLAGDSVTAVLTHAPGGGPLGGLKVQSARGWAAARPSGTEQIYKVYAESLVSEQHLAAIIQEMQAIVARALASSIPAPAR